MRVAVITGAAGGIGGATAAAFNSAGYRLALVDIRKAILPDPKAGISLTCDLANPQEVQGAFEEIAAAFGQIDALANIAGVNHRSPVRDMQLNDWNRMLDINVGSMFLTTQAAIPLLKKAASPAVVNMASISGHVASPDYPAYVTTKAAVESLTWALARALEPDQIRVNAVAPGWVAAGFTSAAISEAEDPSALMEAARKAHVLGRMAEPTEIAQTICWLASAPAAGVNGTTLFVDGGLMRVH